MCCHEGPSGASDGSAVGATSIGGERCLNPLDFISLTQG